MLEVQRRKVKMSIWVRSLSISPLPCSPLDIFSLPAVASRIGKGQTLRCPSRFAWYGTAGHFGPGTLPHDHNIILPRCAGRHTWYEYFPALRFCLFSSGSWASFVHMRARVIVYDVSSRKSFEALPRWLEEFENYVLREVVKIVVGNKLDKVSKYPRSFFFGSSPPLSTPDLLTHVRHLGELSRSAYGRSRGVRGAQGMSFCRGVLQDGGGRDRRVQRRPRVHYRHALVVAREIVVQDCRRRCDRARQHHHRSWTACS